MADLPIVIPDTAVAPKDYTLTGGQELQLKSVRALIDGTGAATSFRPTLQLLDPNGHVMWEGASFDAVAAGGSADVSWFPGVTAASSGIRYDIENTGDWLYATATGVGPATPLGAGQSIFLNATGVTGSMAVSTDVELLLVAGESTPLDNTTITMTAAELQLATNNGSIDLLGSNSDVNISATGAASSVSIIAGDNINISGFNQTSIEAPFKIAHIPLADPGVSGQVWSDAGTLKISP